MGALLLLFAFIGIFFIAERRERTPKIEEGDVQNIDLFSISTFDGRTMYEEIIKATKDFDPMYVLHRNRWAWKRLQGRAVLRYYCSCEKGFTHPT